MRPLRLTLLCLTAILVASVSRADVERTYTIDWKQSCHSVTTYGVSISPDGNTIAAASDSAIKMWNAATGDLEYELKGHTGLVYTVSFTPSGDSLVSTATDSTIRVWDLVDTMLVQTITDTTDWVRAMNVTPNGRSIVTGALHGEIAVWDLHSGTKVQELAQSGYGFYDIALTPVGTTVAANGSWILVFDWSTGELIHDVGETEGDSYPGGVAVHPTGQTYFVPDQTMSRIWELRIDDGERVRWFASDYNVFFLAVSSDGGALIAGNSNFFGNGGISVFSLETGSEVAHLTEGHEENSNSSIETIAISPDGTYFVSGSSYDSTIVKWRVDPPFGQTVSAISDQDADHPGRATLYPPSPNPFNATTHIRFATPSLDHATLRIFDVSGRLVRTLVDTPLNAGAHEVTWDGSNSTGKSVGSGVYLCELRVSGERLVQRVTLLR